MHIDPHLEIFVSGFKSLSPTLLLEYNFFLQFSGLVYSELTVDAFQCTKYMRTSAGYSMNNLMLF